MTRRSLRKHAALAAVATLAAAGTLAAGVGVAGASPAAKPQTRHGKPVTEAQVLGLFDEWNAALQTGDPQKVAARYAKDAVLLPTVSDDVRSDRAEIVDYFEHFLRNKPVGTKIESHVDVLDRNTVIDAGTYEFALTDPRTGRESTVEARYTYVYEKQANGQWLIVNHHSSKMPEG
ncbi:SgcJ/EcaC family oxidoreductase [Streptomyces sp. NPDC007808]|uniref:SgcJ/EcaC family oxidoreductase n=1 Tax=Streptomyces sp. NPDC007808 TaxID=3364779 RepID=UPI00368376FB